MTAKLHFQVAALLSAMVLSATALAAVAADEGAPERQQTQAPPVVVVQAAAATLQEKLAGRQEYYAANKGELFELINDVLLPSFDVRYAGKLVLGRTHWLAATEEQRERFIEVFYNFLVKTYAKGILEFDQEKMVVYPGPSYSKDGRKALVRTELIVDGSDNVEVNYSVRQAEDGWKIYDIRIEGVSYIQNYRNQFDAEISAQGIEAVIVRLEQEIEKAEAADSQEAVQST